MAKSLDNYTDLEELGINISEGNDPLTSVFVRATQHLQKLLPNVENQTLLTLYGYYKQGTEGSCSIPKPSWYDIRSKSKWDAWNKLGNMPQSEAKTLYIKTIKSIDPNFEDSLEDNSPNDQWVKVSSMVEEVTIPRSDMNIVDYIKNGNVEKVKGYLNSNSGTIKSVINKLDEEGLALIHWATDSGYQNIIEILVNNGADINILDADGQTPLHYASSCSHVECVKFLLEKGAMTNILDNDGNNPLSVASCSEVKELLN